MKCFKYCTPVYLDSRRVSSRESETERETERERERERESERERQTPTLKSKYFLSTEQNI